MFKKLPCAFLHRGLPRLGRALRESRKYWNFLLFRVKNLLFSAKLNILKEILGDIRLLKRSKIHSGYFFTTQAMVEAGCLSLFTRTS